MVGCLQVQQHTITLPTTQEINETLHDTVVKNALKSPHSMN